MFNVENDVLTVSRRIGYILESCWELMSFDILNGPKKSSSLMSKGFQRAVCKVGE